VPVNEIEFVKQTVELLNFYKNNPVEYLKKCQSTQQHARQYDWSTVIHYWVSLLS
jgi:hypothetical protein